MYLSVSLAGDEIFPHLKVILLDRIECSRTEYHPTHEEKW